VSLNYLLLGITRDGATGYEIKRAFDEGLRHIWDAELSQIYTTLQRMEGSGLLKSTRLPGERGTGRRVYKLTAAGRRELKQWLRSDPVLHDERHPFLVQLCLLGELGDEAETLKYFQALRAAMRARLQAMEAIGEKWRRHDPSYPHVAASKDFHMQLTLGFGLANARAGIECCERSIIRVRARIAAATVRKGRNEKRKSTS
jgi:DNA-binding PadR family transcriptional regulator